MPISLGGAPLWGACPGLPTPRAAAAAGRRRHAAILTITCNDAKSKKKAKKVRQLEYHQRQQQRQQEVQGSKSQPQETPLRITPGNLGTIGLSRAKRWVKERRSQAKPLAFRQIAYTKRTLTEEERQRERENQEALRLASLEIKDRRPSLLSLHCTKHDKNAPVVLVDAYNVVGYQRDNKKYCSKAFAALSRDDAFGELGRRSLEDDLMEYSAVRGVKVVMVWDAMNGAGMGAVSSEMRCGIEIIYSGASEADTFIMKLVKQLKEDGVPLCIVVTSDREMRECIDGAHFISAPALLRELRQVDGDREEMERLQRGHSAGSRMFERIQQTNPALYQQLCSIADTNRGGSAASGPRKQDLGPRRGAPEPQLGPAPGCEEAPPEQTPEQN